MLKVKKMKNCGQKYLFKSENNDEFICSKIEVEGFNYYINDDEIPYNSNGGTNGDFICLGEIIRNNELGLKKGDRQYISPFVKNVGSCTGCRRIISTDNPSFNIPKMNFIKVS